MPVSFPLETAKGLLYLSRLAYDTPAEVRVALKEDAVRVRRSRVLTGPRAVRFIAHRDAHVDTEAFALRSQRGDVVVAFRGSEGARGEGAVRDWLLTDADALLVEHSLLPKVPKEQERLRVHRGFQRAYLAVRDALRARVQEQLDAGSGDRRVFVTGHSLGGGLATLAAFDLARSFSVKTQLFTFGSPRVGNGPFARAARRALHRCYLITQAGDPVPYLPPAGPWRRGCGGLRYAHLRGIRTVDEAGQVSAAQRSPPPLPDFQRHLTGSYREALERVG